MATKLFHGLEWCFCNFQGSSAHRIVTTKKELNLNGIEDNTSCHYCGDDDSLLYSFLGCQVAVDFPGKCYACLMKRTETPSMALNSEKFLIKRRRPKKKKKYFSEQLLITIIKLKNLISASSMPNSTTM